MRQQENKHNSLGGSPRRFLATHPQQAQGFQGTCYRSGLHRPPPCSVPPAHLCTTAGLGKVGWALGGRNKELGSARPGERRRGREGTEVLTLRVSLSYRWRGGPHFNAPNPLHQGEDAGQVEGKGDGKVDRSVQTRKRKGSASLVNPGWQR